MPRYLVEGQLGGDADFPPADLPDVMERNLMASVTWIWSLVGEPRSYWLYEGPHPEAVRRAASASGLQVEGVREVRLFDPHGYVVAGRDGTEEPS